MIEFKKSSHDPLVDDSLAFSKPIEAFRPGLVTRPIVIPMTTEISAVMANQIRGR